MEKKYVFLVLLLHLSFVSVAQLSDLHYLPPLKQYTNNNAIVQQSVYLSTPETTAFDVRVYRGNSGTILTTLTGLSNTNSIKYDLANGDNNITLVTNANTGVVLSNGGLRFESSGGKKFYVNYRGRHTSQAASLTSKGRSAIGTKFKWGGIPLRSTNTASQSATLGIMATVDNTTVDIYGYDPNCVFRQGTNAAGITSNTIQITLNEGQSYVLEAILAQATENLDGWLGATIESDKDIVISNGGLLNMVLAGSGSRDAGIDQPVPEDIIGKDYVFVRGNGVDGMEIPIIIATKDNTEIFVNGSATPIATINNGDYFDIPSSNYSGTSAGANMLVTTSERAYAYQALAGSSSKATGGLNFIAPVNCLMPKELDNIPDIRNVAGKNFTGGVTIIASTSTLDANIVVTDGTGTITLPASTPVAGSADWKTFFVSGLTGDVSVQSTGPISVGFLGANSSAGIAGYFSGFDTAPVVDLQITGGGCLPGGTVEEITGSFDAYQWYKDGVLVPGATSSSYTPPPTVTFAELFVRVTQGSCTFDSDPLAVYDCSPDIVLNKTADAASYEIGDIVTYTITVESKGVNPVTNLVVTDNIPSGLTLVSAIPDFGSWSAPNWTIGTINSGEKYTLTIQATVDNPAAFNTITNTVTNTQDQADSNNTADDPSEMITIVADNDGDGIYDSVDLDDDNDGILDTDEGFCDGSSGRPFTSLGAARNINAAGVYYFNLNGQSFSTYVNENGYVRVALDFGDGVGTLPQSSSLISTARGLLSNAVLAELTDANEIRFSSSDGQVDVSNTNATLLTRLRANQTLHGGVGDNTFNDGWTGINAIVLTANATCTSSSGSTLADNIFHPCGNSNTTHWISSISMQRVQHVLGEISNTDFLSLWVKAPAVYCSIDTDSDGIPDYLDLDSDNDGCNDALEGDENVVVSQLDANGRINIATQGGIDGSGVPNLVNTGGGADIGGDQGQGATGNETIATTIQIDTQPTNSTICLGVNATFSVGASSLNTTTYTGTPPATIPDYSGSTPTTAGLVYQWQEQVAGAGAWNDLSNGGIYSNTTTATLTLTNPPESASTNKYRLIITSTNNVCSNITSSEVTLVINPVPTVATPPTETICSNVALNHDLSTDVSSAGITFSWLAADNSNVTGETTSASTATSITDTLINTSGSVQTVIYTITPTGSNGCVGDAYTYTVTVNPQPLITSVTTNTDICEGEDAIFTITGSPSAVLTYNLDGNPNQTITLDALGDAVVTKSSTTINSTINLVSIEYSATSCSTTLSNSETVIVNSYPALTTATDLMECASMPLQTLDANNGITYGANISIQWFDALSGGSVVANPTHNAIGSISYYAEITNTTTSCVNPIRQEIELTLVEPPFPDFTETVCSDQALNVSMSTFSSSYSVSSSDPTNVPPGPDRVTPISANITDTYTNTTGVPVTITYTVTIDSPVACQGEVFEVIVTVNPEPSVATAPTDTVCSDVALNHDLTSDVDLAGSSFSWQAADNANVTGETITAATTTSITDVLTNTSGSVQTVIYTITPTGSNGCVGDVYTYTVTVNPEPSVATVPTDTVCSDVALNHDLTSDVDLAGSTFSWLAADNVNVTGETTSTATTTSITDVLTNTSGSVQTVIYTITPTGSNGCVGDAYTYTVTVNPEPSVATAPTDTVCSDVALNHDLTSDVDLAGSTFSWLAADNANVTGETITAATATSITDVLTNTSGSVQTVIYTITPTGSNGCVGDAYTYTVTVNPEPFVATAPTDTVCSDVALNHDLTSDVDLAGSTFSWLAADNVNVTGETTSTATTTSITDVLTNTSGSVQTVIYTITPTGSNGCVGDAYTYTVTVNPEPSVATAPTDTVCSDVALNHDLTSDVDLVGSTFSWLAADNANVIGETTSAATTTSITDVLTNTSGSVQTVIYTITPTGSNGCVGDAYTYTVTVNPEPSVATAPTDTVCSDVALNHDLSLDTNLGGTIFSWQAADNVNVTGETTSVSTVSLITDVLTNTSGSVQTVIYTITPTGSNGCVGDTYTYTITVNPEPSVATAPTDTVCSDVALNHDLSLDTNLGGTIFSWLAADNVNVTGETTSAATATSITDVLTNTSGSVQTVIYTITPTGSNGCVGDAYTYTVTVNPEPSVATAPTDTVCSDVALNHDLTSDVDLAGSTFSWLAADNVNVTGETTSAATTTSITDVLTNTSGSVQTVIYTITPTGSNGCVGDAYTYSVTVNPEPSVATTPTDTVCSDVALNHDLTSDVDLAGSTFSWLAADNVNVTGETTSAATTTSITDVLTNTSGSVQTVIYTITPTGSNGCVGDAYTYTVTVNPEPFVATAPTDTVCSDVALNHDLTSDVDLAGSSFSWQAADNVNVTGETTSAATTTSITDVLTNTSGSVQTVIYTITPTGSNGCVGDAYTYTVTVNPEPSVATAPTDTVCSDVALNHDLTSDVDLVGSTFSWQAADNVNVTGETTSAATTTSITDVLTNTSGSVQTVIYTITPTGSNGCVGDAYTYTVTVNPEPSVATAPTDTVCSDVALNHDLTSDVDLAGSSFSWQAADNVNVTGETTSAATTTSITDVLTNTSGSVQTVIYTITPTGSNGCVGDVYTYTVTVNPEPSVATAPTDTVCSDVALNHDLTSDVDLVGSTFSWLAADNVNVTGETTSAATTTSITDVLTNTSGSVQTVIYTITPTGSNGCVGDAYTYTVTVNPEPSVATAPTDTVCSDVALNHDLTSDVDLAGSSFSWQAADNVNVTGETTSAATTTSITDVLTNTSGSVQTVIYTITPTGSNGCVGDAYTYTVTVNPEPFVATAPTDTVCSDVALNHDLTSDVDLAGSSFSWQAADNVNVTGETTSAATTTSITDVLTNTSGSVQTVIYTITPTGSNGCVGDAYTYTVTVNPEPSVATAPTDTVCSDVALNHDLTSDVDLAGSSFSWLAADNVNVTGETTSAATTTSITDVLTNTSGSVQTVIYTITPTGSNGCVGDAYTYTVTVNPEPSVATAPTDTVCSDVALNHDLTSDVDLAGSSFSWQAADNVNVTGETTSAATTTSITDVLTNTSGSVQTVIYTITPTGSNGCVGDAYTYTVTVNPEPSVATAPTDTVCSDVALNHDLTSDVDLAGSTFSWQAADNANVTGETTSATTTTSITDVLTNTSGSVQTVIYTITPTGSNGCVGDTYTYTVTVNPEPSVATAPTDTVCSDVALNHDLTSDVDLAGSSFSWQAADNVNVTGETTSAATTTSITDVLTNTSGSVQTVIYTITPTGSNGCVGDAYTYTVTVNPEPSVATAPTDTVCSDVALNHDLTSDVDLAGSTFSWQAADNVNVTGETTSATTTTSITDVLTNTSGSVQTVIYTITPTGSNGCVGDTYTYTVTVNPEPSVATAPTDTVCSDVALNHDLTSDVDLAGSSFSWQAADNVNVTGETTSAATTTSITDVLTNTSGSVQTVIYTITPTGSNGCVGDVYTYTVTVNPEPFVATAPTDTVCSDVALNHDLTSDVDLAGSSFSWQAADNVNVTGETTSAATTTSITDVLTNTSGSVQTVIYTITPTGSNGCVGDAYTYTVTINPEPSVATAPADTVCSDVALNHDLTSDVDLVGSTFSWLAADNVNVTGETTSAATITSITDVLTNTSGSVQTVIYTITPTGSNGCVGDAYTYTVTVLPSPELIITKESLVPSDGAYDTVGEEIIYEIIISNPREVDLNSIVVTDANAEFISSPNIPVLAAYSSITLMARHTITQSDLDNGTVTNSATVEGQDPCGTIATDTSDDPNTTTPNDPTVTQLSQKPSLSLLKSSDVAPDGLWDELGEIITYSLELTNTGNVTLTNVVITDSNADAGSILPSNIVSIAPGETISIVAAHTITQSDLDNGSVSNTASVQAQDPNGGSVTDISDDPNNSEDNDADGDGDPDDITITNTPQQGSLDITKEVNETAYMNIGDIISYTIEVTNTGNVTLFDVTVIDPIVNFTSSNMISALAPNESVIIRAEHIVEQQDMINEMVANTAVVNALLPDLTSPISEDSDDPNDFSNVDTDGDGDFDDPTVIYLDIDGDGVINLDDLDDDNDGITDIEEQNEDPNLDTDDDGIIDRLDLDADGDGVLDVYESGANLEGLTVSNEGRIEGSVGTDGIPDGVQNIGEINDGTVNYSIQDTDDDGIDDFQDIDDDNDGILTADENPDPNGDGNPDDAFDTDGNGTPDYLEPNVPTDGGEDGITIFTGMSPNGDGVNDVLVISGIERLENTLDIYNRWGVKVFGAENYGRSDNFFSGVSVGRSTVEDTDQLPVGTYYYVLEYVLESGERKSRVGYIYLNR